MANDPNQRAPFFDTLLLTLVIAAGVVVLAGLFVDMHAKFAFENWLGFFGVFAFVASGVLALLAKFVLRPFVKRPAEYYDKDASDKSSASAAAPEERS